MNRQKRNISESDGWDVMKHYFIINPVAGRPEEKEGLRQEIIRVMTAQEEPWEIYVTRCAGDAEDYVRRKGRAAQGLVRFYACGGDGTLNEVVNGAAGLDRVQVACFPCGSGNDFVRSFDEPGDFQNIRRLVGGRTKVLDLLKINQRFCLNICNLGFDAQVAMGMGRFKGIPFVEGSMAYNLSLLRSFLRRIGCELSIELEGEEIRENFLMVLLANGRFYGGGYEGAPKAAFDDGLLDLVMVKKLSRRKMIGLIGVYRAGKHLDDPALKEVIHWRRLTRLRVKSREPVSLCIDGESLQATDFTAEIVPGILNFVIP